MIRKYTILASVFAVLGFSSPVQAQTVKDAAMNVQSLLDKLSEMRSKLKQAQSSLNIETMTGNAIGQFGNITGAIADPKQKASAQELALQVLPDDVAKLTDEPEKASEWFRDKMHPKKGASIEEVQETRKKADEFQYVLAATSYGKAVAARKKLDTAMKGIEKLRQDAENAKTESDLNDQINKLGLLKFDQVELTQVLKATTLQSENFNKTRVSEINENIQQQQ